MKKLGNTIFMMAGGVALALIVFRVVVGGMVEYVDSNFGDGVSLILIAFVGGLMMASVIWFFSANQTIRTQKVTADMTNEAHRAAGEDLIAVDKERMRNQLEYTRGMKEAIKADSAIKVLDKRTEHEHEKQAAKNAGLLTREGIKAQVKEMLGMKEEQEIDGEWSEFFGPDDNPDDGDDPIFLE